MSRVLLNEDGTARRRAAGPRRPAALPASVLAAPAVLAVATVLAATVGMAAPAGATETVASPVASTATASASIAPLPGTLRLLVTHALDGGRLILKIADRAILSTPLAALRGTDGRPRERDLSVPGGRHALTVQMLDVRGRVVGQGIIHGTIGVSDIATLVVAARPGPGRGLTLSWRTP